MKVGAIVPVGVGNGNPEFVAALGTALEERGFESVWIPEHVLLFDEYPKSRYPYTPDGVMPIPPNSGVMDPFITLSFLAASTEKLRLGTGLVILGQRNPVYTARQATDVDRLSNGRLDLGVGLGWLREEYEALGVPWERRGARTSEYIEVLRTLWTQETSSFEGEFYSLPPSLMYPKPVQSPHPPVHVGGDSDAALRRTARHGDAWFGMGQTPEDLPERLEALDAALAQEGRKREDIEVSISPPPGACDAEMAKAFEQLGVDRLIVVQFAPEIEPLLAQLDKTAAEIMA